MKKLGLATIAVSAVVLANAANALEYTPYVGLDYTYSNINTEGNSGFSPQYSGANINVGANYNQFFGTELFYQMTGTQNNRDFVGTSTLKSNYKAWGLDLMGYLPLGCDGDVALVGTAGLGEYYFYEKLEGVGRGSHDNATGYRLGGGAIYNIDSNWSVRSLVRYVAIERADVDHLWDFSAGVRYNF